MSVLLNRPFRPCLWKSALVGSSHRLLSNGFSSSSRQSPPCHIACASHLLLSNGFSSSSRQSPPCHIACADPCEDDDAIATGDYTGKLMVMNVNGDGVQTLEKKVPLELVYNHCLGKTSVTIGACDGWVASLKDDGVLCLQDDLNPAASDTHPKRISLPPFVTLPHCQTQIITNVSMSCSPEDDYCTVAVKFLGPQLSFFMPGHREFGWLNVKIEHPCFFSSRVMYSKKDRMFHMPGSGGHLIASWNLLQYMRKPKIQELQFQNLPGLTNTERELLDSCYTSEHLVESRTTGETFLVKWYKKTAEVSDGIAKMKTKAVMVFKLDEQGNAVYTQDIGDLSIFLSKSEPFAVPASSFPGMDPNFVNICDVDEVAFVHLAGSSPIFSKNIKFPAPFYIPPQNID